MKKTTKLFVDKTIEQLNTELAAGRVEIAKLVIEARTNPAKDSNLIAKKKKALAVLQTVKHAKFMLAALETK